MTAEHRGRQWLRGLAILSVVVLVLGCGAVVVLIAMLGARGPALTAPAATATPGSTLFLSQFQSVRGTRFMYAQITRKYAYSSELFYSSRSTEGGEVHDLVFLDSQTLVSRRLFDGNDQVILRTIQYPDSPDQPNLSGLSPQIKTTPAQWLVYQVVSIDANHDDKRNDKDPFTIAVSDPGGNGYTELLSGITLLYGMSIVEPPQLLVIYIKDGIKTASLLDLDKRTVTSSKPIIDLGSQVE